MKNVLSLILSALLGLITCQSLSAQIRLPKDINSLGRNVDFSKLKASPQTIPQLSPGLLRNINRNSGLLTTPIRPDKLVLPPGPLQPFNPQPQPMPQPFPQPQPQPQPGQNSNGGVHFGWGPAGPSLGIPLGNGGQINVPLRRPGRMMNQPIYQAPGRVLGYGPQGQIYTGGGQVMGSVLTPGRDASQHNGTQRAVRQPIYDNFGNIVGYQQGTVWNNSITGQQHGNMTTYTPNGSGGYHQSTTLYSQAGGNITPMTGK